MNNKLAVRQSLYPVKDRQNGRPFAYLKSNMSEYSKGGNMRSKAAAGTIAGILAGVIFGIIMMFTTASSPTGAEVSMLESMALAVGAESVWAGWLLQLISSAIIGLIFGAAFGNKVANYKSGAGYGALFGVIWWAVNGLLIMPLMGAGVALGFGTLIGYLVFGVVMGSLFVALRHKPGRPVRRQRTTEAPA